MQMEIMTEVLIDAKPEKIWDILVDTKNYPKWNPFITSLTGEMIVGKKINVSIEPV